MYSQHYSSLHQYALPGGPHSGAPSSLMISPPSQQNGEPHHRFAPPPQRTGSLVNKPIHFTEGQFAGKTIRAKLEEIQAASFGRKYAKVDRRPLDPPPVAWLRLFEVFNSGTDAETEQEIDYDSMHILGLMCTVELLPCGPLGAPSSPTTPSNFSDSHYSPPPQSPDATYGFGSPSSQQSSCVSSAYSSPSSPGIRVDYTSEGSPGPHKATTALAGTTFVQVDSIPWKGKTSLLFTFADLAVKTEGYFILQYRFFDLFSRPTGQIEKPIQAECCGVAFRIYSSKEVPPLGRSTELTKHLARYGVRVNVREQERKRKKKERAPSVTSSPYTMRKVNDPVHSEGSDDD
ncbi:velvet factor-domain-containing protein [Mycena metata]|uniref:Velvet factor-domain-containing protein n=1 Tax=Mycena metata TaxID=1033252 RepID=A0AAD7MPG2_9AGAR|nr:velvet factor-domain-containing protein [Mycena metata]